MKKLYILLFTIFLLACNNKEQAQEHPVTPPNNIIVPKALQNYYKGIHFAKNGKALYDDLAVLTISKHTNFLSYYDRHKYLYKADASLKNPENVVLVYTGEERYWKE